MLRSAASFLDPPPPLLTRLLLPAGSGKTFTAMMMHLQLLRHEHPNQILVYSVPTKQVCVMHAMGQAGAWGWQASNALLTPLCGRGCRAAACSVRPALRKLVPPAARAACVLPRARRC